MGQEGGVFILEPHAFIPFPPSSPEKPASISHCIQREAVTEEHPQGEARCAQSSYRPAEERRKEAFTAGLSVLALKARPLNPFGGRLVPCEQTGKGAGISTPPSYTLSKQLQSNRENQKARASQRGSRFWQRQLVFSRLTLCRE